MALGKASPQARYHFTRLDQVEQLVRASKADPDLGFMARLMALCSLPRTNPGRPLQYKRVNGPYTLYMIAGGGQTALRTIPVDKPAQKPTRIKKLRKPSANALRGRESPPGCQGASGRHSRAPARGWLII